jgi:hypothetical protein
MAAVLPMNAAAGLIAIDPLSRNLMQRNPGASPGFFVSGHLLVEEQCQLATIICSCVHAVMLEIADKDRAEA